MAMINKTKTEVNKGGSQLSENETIREGKNPIIVKYILKSH